MSQHPIMGGQESPGSDSTSQPPVLPAEPTSVHTCPYCNHAHPGDIKTTIPALAALLAAAIPAARALDRFVQLHDPRGSDLRALEQLRDALALFGVTEHAHLPLHPLPFSNPNAADRPN